MPKKPEKIVHPNLYAALAAAQGAFPPIPKGQTARVKMRAGGEYTYQYADLADVIGAVAPALSANGIAFVQKVQDELQTIGDRTFGLISVETILFHESGGETISSTLRCSCGDDPQAIGTVTTYLRRYGLAGLVGVAPEADTDANDARPSEGKPGKPASRSSAKRPAGEGMGAPMMAEAMRQARPREEIAFANLRRTIARLGAKNTADADAVVRSMTLDAEGVPFVDALADLDPTSNHADRVETSEIVGYVTMIVRAIELSESEDSLSPAEILDYARQTQADGGVLHAPGARREEGE